jgi:predicted negative regulator of RcsB-dependent stress response
MDTQHRHELKTNELADWIYHAPDYLRQNIRWIIGGGLILAAVIVFIFSRGFRTNAFEYQLGQTSSQIEALQRAQIMAIRNQMQDNPVLSDSLFSSANKLEMAAQESKFPALAALALIKRGDALRMDLHYNGADVEDSVLQARIDAAQKAYNDAIEKAKDSPNKNDLTAMAQLGLALCLEETGQFDQAKAAYQAIVDNKDFAHTIYPKQAKHRMSVMNEKKEQFVFVDAPVKPEILPVPTPEGIVPPVTGQSTSSPTIPVVPAPENRPAEQPKPADLPTSPSAPAEQPPAQPVPQPAPQPAGAPITPAPQDPQPK